MNMMDLVFLFSSYLSTSSIYTISPNTIISPAAPDPILYPLTTRTNPSSYQVSDNINDRHSFAAKQLRSAALKSATARSDSFDRATPVRPRHAHTRKRPTYDDSQSNITYRNPVSDQEPLLSPRLWVEDDHDESDSVKSVTVLTSVVSSFPSTYDLRRTDSVPVLTPNQKSFRGKTRAANHEDSSQESTTVKNYKLHLERAKDGVRLLRSLDSKASTARSSLQKSICYHGREIGYQTPIQTLLRSLFFWSSFLLFLSGISLMFSALGMIVTKKADDLTVSSWIVFGLVCSIVITIIAGASTSLVFMKKGNISRWFLEKLGLSEVRNCVDCDLESGRRGGGGVYLDVSNREGISALGGSQDNTRERSRCSVLQRDPQDGQATTGNANTVTIDKIDPIWKDLYDTPDQSRHSTSIHNKPPYMPSKLRHRVSQENPDLGIQQLVPIRSVSRVCERERNFPMKHGAVSRLKSWEDEEIELVALDGKKSAESCGYQR